MRKEALAERKISVNTQEAYKNLHHQLPDKKNPKFIEEENLFMITPSFNL